MKASRHLCLALLIAGHASSQEFKTADDVTAAGRGLERPLRIIFDTKGPSAAEPRQLFLLIDPSQGLIDADFAGIFARALENHHAALAHTSIGLAHVGGRNLIVVPPGNDPQRLTSELKKILATPSSRIENVYLSLRKLAGSIAGKAGQREILLVSLDNGDAEDDLAATRARLRKAKVRLHVITSEAYLADNYWASHTSAKAPRGSEMKGGDAGYTDLPWGWLFQRDVANEVTPSGFPAYALTSLVAATEGRIFLYSPPSTSKHSCGIYNRCQFCSGDHISEAELYTGHSSPELAPLVVPRKELASILAGDPYFRAVTKAWRAAAEAGLLRSYPPLNLMRTSARPQRSRGARNLNLYGLSFSRQAKTAEKAASEATRIRETLDAAIARVGLERGLPRQRAMARLSSLLLQVTKVNLLAYSAFCRELGPELIDPGRPILAAPEHELVERDRRPSGISYTTMPLCHGAEPFYGIELPGDVALRPELEALARRMNAFLFDYSHSPYVVALHRSGIARFHLTYPGIAGNVSRRRPTSAAPGGPDTGGRRPTRRGAGRSTGTTGPTTGGKR